MTRLGGGVGGFWWGSVGHGRVCKENGHDPGVLGTGRRKEVKPNGSWAAGCLSPLISGVVTSYEHAALKED